MTHGSQYSCRYYGRLNTEMYHWSGLVILQGLRHDDAGLAVPVLMS